LKKTAPRKKTGHRKKAAGSGAGEREFVRQAVSDATGVTFEVVAPNPGFPLAVEKLEWFMRCRNKDEIARAPYLNVVWKEKGDGIWMESLAVGDTVDWVELAYGEEAVNKSLDLDYAAYDDPSVKADFKAKFPIVYGRIEEYEEAVTSIARRRKLKLGLRHVGSRGVLVFTVAAKLETRKGAGVASMKSSIEKNSGGLREAYGAVSNL